MGGGGEGGDEGGNEGGGDGGGGGGGVSLLSVLPLILLWRGGGGVEGRVILIGRTVDGGGGVVGVMVMVVVSCKR